MVLSLFSGCGKSARPQETVENNETLPESTEASEVEVPVMVDPDTGDLPLGDVTRQILVADFNDFMNNYTLTPCVIEPN